MTCLKTLPGHNSSICHRKGAPKNWRPVGMSKHGTTIRVECAWLTESSRCQEKVVGDRIQEMNNDTTGLNMAKNLDEQAS
jgi:hypothetical protein